MPTTCPVVQAAAGSARAAIQRAMSSGSPRRPSGMLRRSSSLICPMALRGRPERSRASLSVGPGAMALLADAALRELDRPAPGQVLQCGLAGSVLADAGCRLVPERAGDIDYRPARPLGGGERELGQQRWSENVCAPQRLGGLARRLSERRGCHRTRVVDQYMQLTGDLEGGLHDALRIRDPGHVSGRWADGFAAGGGGSLQGRLPAAG